VADLPSVAYPLSKLQARVGRGVLRADLASASNDYADYINEAIREFEKARSWSFMKKTGTITLSAGDLTVALPADFKEFVAERDKSPVNQILNDPDMPGAKKPVRLGFESQELMRLWKFSNLVVSFGFFGMPTLCVRRENSGLFLCLTLPNLQDLELEVNYYAYLPPLTAATDTHPLADAYPSMVIAKAKALALADINDPVVADLENYAQVKFKAASLQDSRSDLVGHDLHM
jgi:hypothetical protein